MINVNDAADDDAIQPHVYSICYAFDLTLWTECTFIWIMTNALEPIVIVVFTIQAKWFKKKIDETFHWNYQNNHKYE